MLFYCPNCKKEVEVLEKEQIVTKSGRVAHKADCPTCGQDMAEFIPGEKQQPATEEGNSQESVGVPQPPEAQAPETSPAPIAVAAPASENPAPTAPTTPATQAPSSPEAPTAPSTSATTPTPPIATSAQTTVPATTPQSTPAESMDAQNALNEAAAEIRTPITETPPVQTSE